MLRLFISFILFCISCSIPSFAARTITIDSIEYSISNQEATVISCLKKCKSINIPNSIENDIIVTTIGSYAFAGSTLESILLPNSITKLSDNAFHNSYKLNNISLPNSIISIGAGAFSHCSSLEFISLPDSVTTIRSNVFYNCRNLRNIVFSDSLVSIGSHAFQDCENLNNISIPNSITNIGPYAFERSGLTSITLSNSMTDIDNYAFKDCTKLESVIIPGSIKRIWDEAFVGCVNLKTAELQDGVEIIERRAFYKCSNLTIIIPPSVNTFGPNAITGVKNIYISYKTPPQINRSNISQSYIYVPWGLRSIYMDSDWNQGLRILCYGSYPHIDVNLTSPGTLVHHFNLDSVLSIGSLKITGAINGTDLIAINKMKNLEEIDLSEATIVAGGLPYYQTDQESYYTINDNFGYNSFYNIYPSIVYLPKVKRIESQSLNSRYITQLSVPSGIERIEAKAFSGALIHEIKLPSTLRFIGKSAFSYCKSLNNINLPTKLETIEESAFYSSSIQSIIVPPFVTELTTDVFGYCKNLKDITIPQNIKTINNPFNGCIFSKMIIEDSTEKLIGSGGSFTVDTLYLGRNFVDLHGWNIKDVITIGPNITTIPPSAFNSDCSFSKVSFHKSITSIGDKAFENSSIKEVYSENPEPPEISENTFTSTVYANATLYVPSESLTTYWLHRYWGRFASIKPLEDQTIIQTPQVDNLRININGNSITVENSGDSYFQIFDISGKRIYHGKQSTVSNLSTGIYILKLGNQTKKFAITM